jgi:integrase
MSRLRNKLSVKQVANLSDVGVHSDGGGLYLRVRQAVGGVTRSWVFISNVGGKRREYGLGSALDVQLSKARARAAELRESFSDGHVPAGRRAAAKKRDTDPVVFGAFAEEFIDGIEDGFRNAKHRAQWRSSLRTYAAPIWAMRIADIDTDDVLDILKPIWLEKSETARRVRGRIEQVLDAAKVRGLRNGENPARFKGHLALLLPKQSKLAKKHHAALPYADLPEFMPQLRSRAAPAARALEFTILTAARSGEVRGMTWGEINFAAKRWSIPAERMKAGVAHDVPLSTAAMKLLYKLRPSRAKRDDLVFRGTRGGPMSDMTLTQLLRRMDKGNITVHGFRSTFRDWVGDETNFPRELAELALAHSVGSGVELAYRRGTAFEKRRLLMELWAAYCSGRPSADDVPHA